MERAHILVVEDEEAIRTGLLDVLDHHGFAAEGEGRGDTGLSRALAGSHDLVLLDLMLPGLNGFDVCKRLRAEKPVLPILILTARGSEEDVLRGFRAGGDDYVTKPFSVAELVARIESLLRRSQAGVDAGRRPFPFGAWKIDPDALRASDGDAEVEITRRDAELLALLHGEAGRIISRRRLLREVWQYENVDRIETRSVDMHIAKLRKKLSAKGNDLIETVRGEGYRYRGQAGR